MSASKRRADRGADEAESHRGSRAAALAIGLAVVAIGLVVLLSDTSARRAGANDISTQAQLFTIRGSGGFCQGQEQIPAGTAAVRLSAVKAGRASPPIEVTVSAGGATIARGRRAASSASGLIAVPLQSTLERDVAGRVCIRLGKGGGIVVGGQETDPSVAARADRQKLPGRLRFEYLRAGRESWWSFAPTIVHRMGLARPWSGPWLPLLAAALTLAASGLALWQCTREQT